GAPYGLGSAVPARPDLLAGEWRAKTIETTEPEVAGHGSTEVATGRATGAGLTTDPAAGGLGLGCPAVGTAPQWHRPNGSCEGSRCTAGAFGKLEPGRAARSSGAGRHRDRLLNMAEMGLGRCHHQARVALAAVGGMRPDRDRHHGLSRGV